MDQASFLGLRALGSRAIDQVTWIYNRPISIDGLRRFHSNLQYGLLSRRVERSPLPFARDRWVYSPGPDDVEIAETPRPRAELIAWANERAQTPIDPEYGPSWNLAALPLEDGGTAISLVTSHTIIDGLGIIDAVADAVRGRTRYLGYPHPGSRSRRKALLEDAKQTIASVPELGRAAAATLRIARHSRDDVAASFAQAPASPQAAGDDAPVQVPCVAMFVDLAEWDACAKSLGGNGNTLFAAFGARLGMRSGRVGADGSVILSFPIGDRTENDTRGNALVFPTVIIDPTHLTSDLGEIRVKFKQAMADLAETMEHALAPLPLTSLTPRWMARRASLVARGAAGLPVGCSNVADFDPDSLRPDGSDADYIFGRLVEDGITKRTLERMGGQLFLVGGRGGGKVTCTITAYRAGGPNTREALRELTSQTLGEFGLKAEIYS
jgi:hypothetical protein